MSYDKVSLLLPMNGANNGTVFADYSPVQKTAALFGGVVTKTDQFKFYDSSGFWDGVNDFIEYPQLLHTTQDFCVECWLRPAGAGTARTFFAQRQKTNANNNGRLTISVNTSNKLAVFLGSGTNLSLASTSDVTAGVWTHVAISKESNLYRIFIGGTLEASGSNSQALESQPSFIGVASFDAFGVGSTNFYSGHIQDFRVTVGDPVRTANFTPPARLIGTIDNSAVGAAKILDINGDPAERTVFAVPRVAPTRVWSDVSSASGEFEIWAPAGVDHSVVAVADETGLRNDIVHRVIPV